MTKRYIFGLVVAAALAAILLTQVDRASLARSLVGVDWQLLICAMALKIVSILLKSQRWGLVIEVGSGWKANNRIFAATVVGLAGNIVLPARMGELARIRMLTRHNDVPAGFMASAAGVAYLLDAVLLSLVFVALSSMSILPQTTSRSLGLAAGTLFLVVAAAWTASRSSSRRLSQIGQSLLHRLPERVASQIARHARGLIGGFGVLRQWRCMPRLLFPTMGIVACEIASVQLGLIAMGIAVSWLVAAALVVALQLSYAFPTTPGNLGAHQVLCVLMLAAFGVSREEAFGFSLAFQGAAHLTVLTLAGMVLLREAWGWTALKSSSQYPPGSA